MRYRKRCFSSETPKVSRSQGAKSRFLVRGRRCTSFRATPRCDCGLSCSSFCSWLACIKCSRTVSVVSHGCLACRSAPATPNIGFDCTGGEFGASPRSGAPRMMVVFFQLTPVVFRCFHECTCTLLKNPAEAFKTLNWFTIPRGLR